MKKILMLIAMVAMFGMNAFAEQGYGSCVIRGTANDYVEVTANLYSVSNGREISGTFTIVNASSKPLMSAYITITAEVNTGTDPNGNLIWKRQTLYQGNWHPTKTNLQPNDRETIELYRVMGYDTRGVQVSVSNPTCQQSW